MKPFLVLAAALSLGLAGCGHQQAAQTTSSVTKKVTSKASSAKKAPVKHEDPWSTAKTAKLAAFMKTWTAKQSSNGGAWYATYTPGQSDTSDFEYPGALKTAPKNFYQWGTTPMKPVWSTNGLGASTDDLVVAVAAQGSGEFVTRYFFIIRGGQPMVLSSQTTNGGAMWFYDVQDEALQAAFAKLVTGKTPHYATTDLNADVASAVKAKTIPKAYQHLWYTRQDGGYNEAGNGVPLGSLFTYKQLSDPKQVVLYQGKPETKPYVLDVYGKDQTAGAGTWIGLRYRFYGGQKVPVLMMASGAMREWYANAYLTQAQAQRMANYEYGDEPKAAQ